MGTTETRETTTTKLARIAKLSASDPFKRFDSLMHLFNEESLAACFHELDGKKAVGVDGGKEAAQVLTGRLASRPARLVPVFRQI